MAIDFGKTIDGREVQLFELSNANGVRAEIITYGGAIVSLKVPDRGGRFADVVLGFDSLSGYEQHRIFLGALIGRCANRIAKGRFSLTGKQYQLAANNGENHLHGGWQGFDRVVWSPTDAAGSRLELSYLSPDGEELYPGNLEANVVYSLNDDDELQIDYSAVTDAETIVNLTNHSYFNLVGAGNGDILGHELMINADGFTPTDAGSIPTGEVRRVEGTPFDFRSPGTIGSRIDEDDEQIQFGRGYDHNWVLNKKGKELSAAAAVYEPKSGRSMDVVTTEPGLQFYSGNFLDGSVVGKDGKPYHHRSAFCLEAQHFPDSPNQPNFPSVVLRAGEEYRQTTIYRFSAR